MKFFASTSALAAAAYGLLVTYHDKLCVLCLVLVLVPVSGEMDGG